MLRSALLAAAVVVLVLACGATVASPDAWPMIPWTAVVVAALAFERRRYGAAQQARPGTGWLQTGERFFDDATGHGVEVWYRPETGERQYVRVD